MLGFKKVKLTPTNANLDPWDIHRLPNVALFNQLRRYWRHVPLPLFPPPGYYPWGSGSCSAPVHLRGRAVEVWLRDSSSCSSLTQPPRLFPEPCEPSPTAIKIFCIYSPSFQANYPTSTTYPYTFSLIIHQEQIRTLKGQLNHKKTAICIIQQELNHPTILIIYIIQQ